MIRGHSFPKSPLSPGVPLEGTDTVAGLQQIARWKTAERFIETTGLHRGMQSFEINFQKLNALRELKFVLTASHHFGLQTHGSSMSDTRGHICIS